jgi:hypothetical protein
VVHRGVGANGLSDIRHDALPATVPSPVSVAGNIMVS